MIQRLHLTDPTPAFRRRDYLYAAEFPNSPFTAPYERLREDPDWHVHRLASGHNVLAGGPDLLLNILLSTIDDQPGHRA